MLLLSVNLFSQNIEDIKKTGDPSEPTFVYERPINCALNTSLLMMDLKQNKDFDYIINRYSINEINNEFYVDAFLKIDKDVFIRRSELANSFGREFSAIRAMVR